MVPLLVEGPTRGAGAAEHAVVLFEDLADLGHRAVAVVGHPFDEVERAAGPGSLVEDLLVGGPFDFTRAALDGARDGVVGHRSRLGVGDRLAQPRIAGKIAAAHTRGHGQLFDELGEDLAALGVEGPFLVFDCGPLRMAAHRRETSLGKRRCKLVAGQNRVNQGRLDGAGLRAGRARRRRHGRAGRSPGAGAARWTGKQRVRRA